MWNLHSLFTDSEYIGFLGRYQSFSIPINNEFIKIILDFQKLEKPYKYLDCIFQVPEPTLGTCIRMIFFSIPSCLCGLCLYSNKIVITCAARFMFMLKKIQKWFATTWLYINTPSLSSMIILTTIWKHVWHLSYSYLIIM